MMYSNKLIVAVKSNGKVLREQGDTVFLPFGQEFTILVKNKNSLRCLVKIEIDGTDATENTSLIVPANGEIELERFIKQGNMMNGNRFKFIERTAAIENGPRGIKVDDGLIRVEFEFEREAAPIKSREDFWYSPYRDEKRYFLGSQTFGSAEGQLLSNNQPRTKSAVRGVAAGSGTTPIMNLAASAATAYNANSIQEDYFFPTSSGRGTEVDVLPGGNEVGITVPGSVSDQKFTVGAWFPTDGVKHVLIMKLLGETTYGQPVTQAVTVKAKPKCVTCGHVNKANAKFCSNCGTSLTIV